VLMMIGGATVPGGGVGGSVGTPPVAV